MNFFDRLGNVIPYVFNRNAHIRGWDFRQFTPSTDYNDYSKEIEKINAVFNSPAVLKVFKTNCDLFSLGKIQLVDRKTGEPKETDPLLELIKKPNPFQTQKQFLWEYCFWRMLGNATLYTESEVATKETNYLYFLDQSKIEYPNEVLQDSDKILFKSKNIRELNDFSITYRYKDGSTKEIANRKLLRFFDLSNGTGNWYKGNSTIDALYKVISNSELFLDSTNVNALLSKKFMVAGKAAINDTKSPMMGQSEKDNIENNVMKNKNIHAVKSMVDIKRFVEDLTKLQLDEGFKQQAYTIGSMFGIPKELLDYSDNGSTYENQEKAIGRHIGYNMQSAGDDLVNGLENKFGYNTTDNDLVISWDHLPFMQVFENEKADVEYKKAQTFAQLVANRVSPAEAGEWLGYDFKNYEKSNNTTQK